MPSVNRSAPTRLIKEFNFTVPGSSVVDYNYITVNKFKFTKFFVEVLNLVTNESSVFSANIAKLSTEEPDDTIFGKVGDNLNYKFNVLKIASDIVIRVENNEPNPVQISVIRITI